jgi:hypothetical protein
MADPKPEKPDQPKAGESLTPEGAAARLNQILSSPIENPFASEPRPSGSHPPAVTPPPSPAPSPRETAIPEPCPVDPAPLAAASDAKPAAPETAAPEATPAVPSETRPGVPPAFAAWEGATAQPPQSAPEPASAPSTEATPAGESSTPPPAEPVPTREGAPPDRDGVDVIVKVRRLMLISTVLTALAIAIVLGIIGYRLLRSEGRQDAAVQATLTLPAGAKIVQTAIADDRIVLTLQVGGALEIRTYDLKTLKPLGRLNFSTVP